MWEAAPGVFGQHLLEPQLIGGIEGMLSVQADGHEFGNVAVLATANPCRGAGAKQNA